MLDEEFKLKLQEIRKSPRKMREDYLRAHGLFDTIQELVPYETFKTKQKIDVILSDWKSLCYCGNLAKVNSNWCSVTCRNKDPDIRKSISVKNTNNSAARLEKAKATRIEKYGVSAVQDIPAAKLKTKQTRQKFVDELRKRTFESRGLDYDKFCDKDFLSKICKKSSLFEVQ